MKFHLNYSPKKSDFEINHSHSLFLIGSCFAENIGEKLNEHRFKIYKNPNGILFNPASILNCLNSILDQKPFDEKFILQRDRLYYSYLHHSSFNSENKEELIHQFNQTNQEAFQFLKHSSYLFITFGTAFVYEHQALNQIVANCHKQAQTIFQKRMLEVDEIVKSYSIHLSQLKQINPNLKIIFTVSPVKYLKDGLEENNLSKSVLRLSIHELMKNHSNCYYFPAFELVNDDLRDYRFYKADLAHPNELAINYIWEKLSQTYFSSQTSELNEEIQKLQLALEHRQMKTKGEETEKLELFIRRQTEEISRRIPSIQFKHSTKKP